MGDNKKSRSLLDSTDELVCKTNDSKREKSSSYDRFNFICRICFSDENAAKSFLSPCLCRGSSMFVHEDCLLSWLKTSSNGTCEICNSAYNVQLGNKPLKNWRLHGLTKFQTFTFFIVIMYSMLFITSLILGAYLIYLRCIGSLAEHDSLTGVSYTIFLIEGMIVLPNIVLTIDIYLQLKK